MNNGLNLRGKGLFLLLWTIMAMGSKAQPGLALYPLKDHFNSFDYNPAFLTSAQKFTFSLFPVAGASVGFNNQEVVRNITSKFIRGVITDQDFKDAFNDIADQSSFHQNAELSLLSFTYRSPIGFFNFRIKDKEYFKGTVGGETTKFIFKSEIQSAVIGQKQQLPAQAAHYREYSLGYSYQSPSQRLTAGIRAKLYYGKFAFYSDISGSIQQDAQRPNNYLLKTSGLINISFPGTTIGNVDDQIHTIDFRGSQINNYLFNKGNPGVGLDLGFNYEVTPKFSVSMSLIDLGKINWKNNLNSRNLNKEYLLDMGTFQINNEGQQVSITKIDGFSYSDTFDFTRFSRDSAAFTKPLPATLYGGFIYQLNSRLSLGMTDRYVIIKDLSYNSLSLTANVDVGKKFSFSSGYSMIGDAWVNIPLAILFKGNIGQFYMSTENIISVLVPSAAQYTGISFGASFYLDPRRNLYLKVSDHTPFYRPRKTIKNRRTGLLIQPDPNK